jgi:hypothetical protein
LTRRAGTNENSEKSDTDETVVTLFAERCNEIRMSMNDPRDLPWPPLAKGGSVRWLLTVVAGVFSAVVTSAAFAAEGPTSFNRDIRGILSDKCFKCHGPDAAARKADLRLDQRQAAFAAGAIVPGKPEESLLVERVFSDDQEQVMPPPATGKTLNAREKELLRRWIAEGAEYQSHWSFLPIPRSVPVPVLAGWVPLGPNAIDAFVRQRLLAEKIEPAVETSREKWLRRVTFDLTGLPPTLAELDAFLADKTTTAYDMVVERLLQSPAYGERMTGDWLDLARYADTFGYQSDRDMHVWPWRDWVIRAFNENLPYDKFIFWQTAGDLLENPTRDQYLATAFNRLHRQTNEGGSIEEEFRVAYIADRVNTNVTAFLGLTSECARCHDHKFDPISQHDFYRLSAFFANIDEHGLYSHFTETAPTPALLLYEGDQEQKHKELLEKIRLKETEVARIREEAKQRRPTSDSAAPSEVAPAARFSFEDVKAAGDYKPAPGKIGQGMEFGGDDAFVCKGDGKFGRATPFSFAIWVKPAEHKPRQIVFHRSVAAEDSAFRGYSLVLDEGHAVFSLVHFWPGNAIRVQTQAQVPIGEWTHVTVSYDGGSRASGLRLYLNGKPAAVDVTRDRLTRDIVHRSEWGDSGNAELALGARFRDSGFKGGVVDEFLVFDRELTEIEIASLGGFKIPATGAAQFEQYLMRGNAPYGAALGELQTLRVAENDLVSQVRQIMVMKELPVPRATHVLRRGAYDAPGDRVEPGTPARVLAFPSDWPKNRLGLARWLIDDRNPLTARVTVNRYWQMFFGRGLVATSEDFGSQGQPPTHPELLDWLARRFIDSGWNVKELCRSIVLSATYRQSTVPRDARIYTDDPDNRLLARGPRYRLSAEQIRDNALAVSGLLVRKIGGPSVMPYQPAGLWEESGTGKSYAQSHGEGLYRRSLYTFWRRTSPPPSMTTFDAVSREVCVARRERTATPLQALVLLNDPQFVEAARVLAEKLFQQAGSTVESRLVTAFRLLTSREPSPAERAILQKLYQEQHARFAAAPQEAKSLLSVGEAPRDEKLDAAELAATAIVVRLLFNFDECVTKR